MGEGCPSSYKGYIGHIRKQCETLTHPLMLKTEHLECKVCRTGHLQVAP